MKTIGIIVGINTDAIDESDFPYWLKDIPDEYFNLSKEKWSKDYYGLSSDMGIAYYLLKKAKNKKNNIKVDILTKKDVNLSTFNKYDYIVGFYCPYYNAHKLKSSDGYKKYNDIIKKTTAIFCQPLQLQKFVLNKKLYTDIMPGLCVIIVGNREDSLLYVNMKIKMVFILEVLTACMHNQLSQNIIQEIFFTKIVLGQL